MTKPSASRDTPFVPQFDELGIAFCESRHSARFRMHWRTDPCHKVLLILDGEGRIDFSSQSSPLSTNSLCVIPAGTRHRLVDENSRPLSLYAICIEPERFLLPSLVDKLFSRPQTFANRDLSSISAHILRKALYEQRFPGPESAPLRFGLLLTLLAEMIRFTNKGDLSSKSPFRERVRDYAGSMQREFWMQTSLDEAAARLEMSRKRFSQLFREITGTSWLEHLRELRIAHARVLLSSTDLPVKAVAFECGFQDLSHFYRVFCSLEGMPPGSFRAHQSGGQVRN